MGKVEKFDKTAKFDQTTQGESETQAEKSDKSVIRLHKLFTNTVACYTNLSINCRMIQKQLSENFLTDRRKDEIK